jgi:hypothetical protein
MCKEFYNSKVYQFYMLEQQEIDKLKWIESEKEGRDIGKNKAVFLWNKYYRKNWLKTLDIT